jgi:hypothetical protein
MAIREVRLFVATMLLAASQSAAAWAAGPKPDKLECIAADTDGQALRLTGNLLRARKRLAVCAAASCPSVVREDCAQRIAEIEAAQPSVVFAATNGHGRPLVAVRVTVDGTQIADHLDGRALPVDPGEHLFVFEALGRVPAQMRLTLKEGEKNEGHAVVLPTGSGDPVDQVPAPEPVVTQAGDFPPAVAESVTPAAPIASASTGPVASAFVQESMPPKAESAPDATGSRMRMAAIAAGGVGAAGVVIGGILGLLTIQEWQKVKEDDCPARPACPASASPAFSAGKTAQTEGVVSTVAFIAGGVGFAVGAWLWFAPPEPSRSTGGISVLPVAGPSRAQLLIRGGF